MSDSELTVANRGIWIPNTVWESKELSIQEKALLAKIHGFEECFASNQYLADFIGLSVTRVKAIIKSLTDKGFITRTEERQGQLTVKRTLTVVAAKYYGLDGHGPENGPTPARKQAQPEPENGHHNNTELVIQNNNTDFPPTGVTAPEGADSVCSLCLGYQWTHGNQCERCKGTGQEPVVNSELTTDQPKAPADTAEKVGQTEHEAAPADKPVKKRKTKAETLLDLIRSKPELLVCLNCVDDTLLLEWCQQRERMKAARTDRALSKIDRALDELRTKHRVAPDAAIEAACDKGWRGLEVEWVLNHLSSTGRNMSYPAQSVPRNNDPDTPIVPKTTQRQAMSDEEIARQKAELANVLKGVE